MVCFFFLKKIIFDSDLVGVNVTNHVLSRKCIFRR